MRSGFESTWVAPLAGLQTRLLGAHFMLLVRLLRRSAKNDYAGFEPNDLVERRIVLSLFRMKQARVAELAGHFGIDIAQVSRAFTSLSQRGLAEKEKQRDPYSLTAEGTRLGGLLDEVAQRRELKLTQGLGPQEMFELAGQLIHLLDRATAVQAEEFAKAGGGGSVRSPSTSAMVEIHARAQPLIFNMATTMSRAATSSYKRIAGVSYYEWRILVNIAYRPLLSFMDLVLHLDSDKAQVSRALDSMVGAGYVRKVRDDRAEPVRLDLSRQGRRVYALMEEDALRRNAMLEEGMTAQQRERLQSYLDKLIANAESMIGRDG